MNRFDYLRGLFLLEDPVGPHDQLVAVADGLVVEEVLLGEGVQEVVVGSDFVTFEVGDGGLVDLEAEDA